MKDLEDKKKKYILFLDGFLHIFSIIDGGM